MQVRTGEETMSLRFRDNITPITISAVTAGWERGSTKVWWALTEPNEVLKGLQVLLWGQSDEQAVEAEVSIKRRDAERVSIVQILFYLGPVGCLRQ